jgi:acetyltransferase-like isoleucine patch superfamily enzyme
MIDERDKVSSAEVISSKKGKKLFFYFWVIKNWFIDRLAAIAPVPSWRVWLHRLKGINIGKNVYIGYYVIFDRIYPEEITLEDYVEIGDRSIISAHQRGSLVNREKYPREIKPVIIKKGAWIMPGSIIIPGITIDIMSIVATGSVVTKNIPAYELWGGVPSKKLKSLN